MSEAMPIPSEEIINPQITPLLEGIDSRLPAEEVGVLTESGRINKQGREIADNVYQEFLSRSNGDFKQVLEHVFTAIENPIAAILEHHLGNPFFVFFNKWSNTSGCN